MSSINENSLTNTAFTGFTGPFVETVEEDGRSAAEESTGSASFASGAADTEATVRVHDLIPMFGDTYCRVLMKPQKGPARICGQGYGVCTRKYHNTLIDEASRRGPEGHFTVGTYGLF